MDIEINALAFWKNSCSDTFGCFILGVLTHECFEVLVFYLIVTISLVYYCYFKIYYNLQEYILPIDK